MRHLIQIPDKRSQVWPLELEIEKRLGYCEAAKLCPLIGKLLAWKGNRCSIPSSRNQQRAEWSRALPKGP